MKITDSMVKQFNKLLFDFNCVFKLELFRNVSNPTYQIVLINDFFVDSAIINPSDEFYVLLENFFSTHGITLKYNNTKTIFCSDSGWDK